MRIKYILVIAEHTTQGTTHTAATVTRARDGVSVQFLPDCERSACVLVRDTFGEVGVWRNDVLTVHKELRTWKQFKYYIEDVERCTTSKGLKKLFRLEAKRLKNKGN